MDLAPGLAVRIVVETDYRRGTIQAIDSTVYEASGDTLVLAQTTPPLEDRMCRGEITVTYLIEEQDGPARYGFPAAILAYIDDYRLASGRRAPALRVAGKAEPAPYSIRTCHRVKPGAGSRLNLYVQYEKATILDISLGGARFSCDWSIPLEANRPVKLRFDVAGEDYTVDAHVLRTWRGKGRLRFAVAEFRKRPGRFEQALARRIHAIERERHRQNSLPDAEDVNL
jgi:hypothetical protein